jgi:site-specific DNA-methyltransferase (adenine-specific)
MPITALDAITIRSRQRKVVDKKAILELRDSILTVGNLHPPVCWHDETTNEWVLTAGETRYEAIKLIAAEGKTYKVDDKVVPAGQIVFLSLSSDLDEAGRVEAELDENLRRRELPWQDRVEAMARLHELRTVSNPSQTMIATAKELSNANGAHVHSNLRSLRVATAVAKHLDNPKIAGARNEKEAFAAVLRADENAAFAALAKRTTVAGANDLLVEVRHGDTLQVLPGLESGMVDLILSDPPYGIDAGSQGFRGRTEHHHNYLDTEESARAILKCIIAEGFRITKPRANMFLFTDIKHWDWLVETSKRYGWDPFRTPLIWQKSDGEGLAPWGSAGPRRTYDLFFYATKGERGLITSPVDIFRVNRVPRNERIHAAEKPVELLKSLIECSTLAGDLVLDPCCGSGSTLVAAQELRRRSLGIEKDKDFYELATSNVFQKGAGGAK